MQVPKISPVSTPLNSVPNANIPVNAPIEAFGGGSAPNATAAAAQNVEHEVRNFAIQQENHANSVAVTNATTQTVMKKNDLLYNPQNGLITRKGSLAFGASEEINGEYQKFQDEMVNSLSNDRQKQDYLANSTHVGLGLNEAVQKHVFVETKRYDDQSTESAINAAQDDAVLNYHVPGTVEQRLEDQKGLILVNAKRNGMPTDLVDKDGKPTITGMMVKNSSSSTISKVVDKMLANDQDQAAEQFYKKFKDQVSGLDSTRLDKNLEEGSLRGKSQRLSDEYTSPSFNDAGQAIPGSQPTMTEAMEKVSEITDPKLRDATSARVKDFYSTQKIAEANDAENLFRDASKTIEETKERPDPATWMKLTPQQRSSADARIKQLRQGIEPETNWQKYYDLKSMASDPQTRDAFMRKDLMQIRTEMGDSEFKELISLQAGVRNKDATAEAKLDGYRTDASIVNDALTAVGIKPNDKAGTTDSQKVALFRRKVDETIATMQERTGKKATNSDVQAIVDNLMVNTITEKGVLWNTRKRAFELNSGDQVDVDFTDIPKSEIPKIRDALQRRGRPVTNDAILDTYKKKIQGQANGG